MKKLIVFILVISFFNCKTKPFVYETGQIDVLDQHTINLLKNQNIKIPKKVEFIHIRYYRLDINEQEIANSKIITKLKPILLKNSNIQEAISLIVEDNRIIGISDGRYIYTKGYNDYNKLYDLIINTQPKEVFILPYQELSKVYFYMNDSKLYIYDQLKSNSLVELK